MHLFSLLLAGLKILSKTLQISDCAPRIPLVLTVSLSLSEQTTRCLSPLSPVQLDLCLKSRSESVLRDFVLSSVTTLALTPSLYREVEFVGY